jgi:hypothetical protein
MVIVQSFGDSRPSLYVIIANLASVAKKSVSTLN